VARGGEHMRDAEARQLVRRVFDALDLEPDAFSASQISETVASVSR
jgi:hypothetical protein